MEDIPLGIEQRVDNHERRITELEKNQYEMKNGMLRIENTVLQQGKEQKDMLSKFIDHFFQDRKDVRQNKTKLSEIRWQTIATLLGGGGVLVLIIQWLLTKI
ncbi:hypothetical protein [Rossellomorea sp. BNER]|uniref:hypothetical protein n=1 Tax=Rossellomorea sp. BNER TaxID=2962031 RepID=UPI003AF24792|nr:hypothetical protein [Rossellomorea sp. BNER]